MLVMPMAARAEIQTEAKIPVQIDLGGVAKIEAVTEGAPMPTEDTITVADGETAFFAMTYTEPDIFEYKITQIPGSEYSVYDDAVYSVLVYIVADDDGIQPITVVVRDSDKTDAVHFVNKNIWDDPSVTKEAMHGGTYEQKVSAKNKDIVNFRLTGKVPKGWTSFHPYSFTFIDRLPDGLEYQNDAKVVFSGEGDITKAADITIKDHVLTVHYEDLNKVATGSGENDTITLTYSVKVDWNKAGELKNFAKVVAGDKKSPEVHATVRVSARSGGSSKNPVKKIVKKAAKSIKTGDASFWTVLGMLCIIIFLGTYKLTDRKRRQ